MNNSFRLFSIGLFIIGTIICSGRSAIAQSDTKNTDVLIRTNPRHAECRSRVLTSIKDNPPALLLFGLPIPSTNPYQTVSDVKVSSVPSGQANTARYPEIDAPYAFSEFHFPAIQTELAVSFRITLYDIAVDFSKIETIYPYHRESAIYKTYTGNSGDIVVPNHPQIAAISQKIAADSDGVLDYARKSYLYVAENYRYLNPNTGLHSLDKLLRDGGGDCGNLSSIYISLLRCYGIPARHLVGICSEDKQHVWADFYLEKYGWIPVDVTFKQGNKEGDFFGRKTFDNDLYIIVSQGVDLTVKGIVKNQVAPKKVELLQTYYLWNRYDSPPAGQLECDFHFETKLLQE